MAHRKDVLSSFRQILHLSRTWVSSDASQTATERQYIRREACDLFKRNKQISDEQIPQHLHEAKARIEIALHYGNPYPRLINLPQSVLPPTSKKYLKGQKRTLNESRPVYLRSYEDQFKPKR